MDYFFGTTISITTGLIVFCFMYSHANFHKYKDFYRVSFNEKLQVIIASILVALFMVSLTYLSICGFL